MSELVNDWETAEAVLAKELQNAKSQLEAMDREINKLNSDNKMLKDTIVRMAMRMEGVH